MLYRFFKNLTALVLIFLCACQSIKDTAETPKDTLSKQKLLGIQENAQTQDYSGANHQDSSIEGLSNKEIIKQIIEKSEQEERKIVRLSELENLWEVINFEQTWRDWSHVRVNREYKKLSKHSYQVRLLSQQAEPYLYYIYHELKKRQMPIELVFLPMVESAYDPLAYSPGGAAGLWQFMPRTGKHFNLHENHWYNGRRDIVASTNAALNYLQSLHKRFGNWHLALAAYNAGQGNVSKAIRKNKRLNKATDYWSLPLPLETRQYVPRLIAWTKMLSEMSHSDFYPIANQPYFENINIGSQLDLAKAAQLAKIDNEKLLELNPSLYRWATPPNGPHRLLVPQQAAEQFKFALQQLPAKERVQWQQHKVKRGESLSVIASRYKVGVKTIKIANKLRNNTIRIGQNLMIPMSGNPQLNTFHQKKQPAGKPVIYRVQKGDSFWSIAKLYGVSIRQITRWNNLSAKSYLQPKQRLKIWPRGRS